MKVALHAVPVLAQPSTHKTKLAKLPISASPLIVAPVDSTMPLLSLCFHAFHHILWLVFHMSGMQQSETCFAIWLMAHIAALSCAGCPWCVESAVNFIL